MNFTWAAKFFDTYWYIKHKNIDPLEDPKMVDWIIPLIIGKKIEVDPGSLTLGLQKFRGEMMPIIEKLQNDEFDHGAVLELLKGYIREAKCRREIISDENGKTEMTFVPDLVDETFILSEMAYMWYLLLFEKDRSRIRICELPECKGVFIDESKNHSKRHCTANCGNVMKVRRHRSKKHSEV